MQDRINKVYLELENNCLDAFICTHQPNIEYLTGFPHHECYLLFLKKQVFLFTDSRYMEEARIFLSGSSVRLRFIKKDLYQSVCGIISKLNLKRIGFESRVISYHDFSSFKKKLGKGKILVPCLNIVENLRMIKNGVEIDKIKTATLMAVGLFIKAKNIVKPGMTESEVSFVLESLIHSLECKPSFPIIVAAGVNSCQAHHIVSKRVIRNSEPVLIDMGFDYFGYKSDLTRTWFLGKITPIFNKVYTVVKEAQTRAISAIKPGAYIPEIDKIARSFIAKKGFGRYFHHSLGHGIGLEVHEKPGINSKNEYVLKEGMVFSVEPAVYLPGKFGVRLEDLVVVTKKGCDCLSGSLNK